MDSQNIYDQVNKRYGAINKSSTGKYERNVAEAFGYAEEELANIPEGANLGLSCGNPNAIANLKEVFRPLGKATTVHVRINRLTDGRNR
jgi:hypothetical protein